MIKPKQRVQYVCSSCGASYPSMRGMCVCKKWNTLEEVAITPKKHVINRVSPKRKEENKQPDIHQEELDKWFDARIAEAKVHPFCEECGCSVLSQLNSKDTWVKRASIAHIFPKRERGGFPSVSCHELNWVLLCIDHHHYLDSSWDKARKMNIWPHITDKAKMFSNLVTEARSKIPDELFVD